MPAAFTVIEHIIDAQYVREYPRATANSQDQVFKLAVKQYVPKARHQPAQDGDVTIIAAHANGFVKELYEPLWDDLLLESRNHGFAIGSIWIADAVWQGQSSVLNEDVLGNDHSWLDNARDIIHLINHFHAQMTRPLIGIGHSFGAVTLANVALMHPRLLSALVLIDPVLVTSPHPLGPAMGILPMRLSNNRRDLWPNRDEAAKTIAKTKLYSTWDPRTIKLLVKHGFRDTPTLLHPEADHVTLTTTKHQEVLTYYRPLAPGITEADVALDVPPQYQAGSTNPIPFYSPISESTTAALPHLRPPVVFIYGGISPLASPATRAANQRITGTGQGGSRYRGEHCGNGEDDRDSNVQAVVIPDLGHLVPLEAPGQVAQAAARFVAGRGIANWRREENVFREWADGKSLREKQMVGEETSKAIKAVKLPDGAMPLKAAKL